MKTSNKRLVMAAIMFVVALSSYAIGTNPGFAQDGAIDGDKETLIGNLVIEGGALSIATPAGSYLIRTGNRQYSASVGMDIQAGTEIAVFGYVSGTDVIPIVIVADGEAFFLRDTDGAPLWTKGRFASVE